MSDIAIELTNVDVTTEGSSLPINATTSVVEPYVVERESLVEGYKKEYSIVGDGLYASVTAEEAPQWLVSLLDSAVINQLSNGLTNVVALKNSVLTALAELDVAKNEYQELINIEATIEGIIASRLTTLNATLDSNSATIAELQTTKVDGDTALSIATSYVTSQVLDGSVSAAIGNVQSTLTTPIAANANSIDALVTTITDPTTGLSATASATESLQTYVGIDAAGASTGTGLSAYLEGVDGTVGSATSQVTNGVYVDSLGDPKAMFEYESTLYKNGSYYTAGFGLDLSASSGNGTKSYPYSSEFWINAEKFKFTNSNQTGQATPFTIDASGTQPQVTFNGLVTFGSGQTGTIDEAIASSIDTIQVGDKNINITDNLIPTTSLITDIYNAGYQFIGDPVKSNAAGIDVFAEPQVLLDANDEVYSPYVDEMFPPYYYRFGIKGITNLNSNFKLATVDSLDNITYSDVTYVMDAGASLVVTDWYIVEGIVNPYGGDSVGLNGSIRTAVGTKIGTITNFALPQSAELLVLGWIGSCTISRMKLAKITADTFTGSVASIDYVDNGIANSGYVLPSEVANAINTNTTTVDGSKITTGSIAAAQIAANTITASSAIIQDGAITNAKIGDVIRSDNFVSGSAGWQITKNGTAEFNSIIARDYIQAGGISRLSNVTVTTGVPVTTTWNTVLNTLAPDQGGSRYVSAAISVTGYRTEGSVLDLRARLIINGTVVCTLLNSGSARAALTVTGGYPTALSGDVPVQVQVYSYVANDGVIDGGSGFILSVTE